MPYELGLDIGCMEYGRDRLKSKKILILESEQYHYLKVISDISGQDIAHHSDDPEEAIIKVRNWFSRNNRKKVLPGATEIWMAFNQFNEYLFVKLESRFTSKEIAEMEIADYIKYFKVWFPAFRPGQ
jgi:hypothetical protein